MAQWVGCHPTNPKSQWFDLQLRHIPAWVAGRLPGQGMQEATSCFSPPFSLPSLFSKDDKLFLTVKIKNMERDGGLRSINWQLQNSQEDVKSSPGNKVSNTLKTMHGARWEHFAKYMVVYPLRCTRETDTK